MGNVRVVCDRCKTAVSAPAGAGGKSFTCKSCGHSVTIPLTATGIVEARPQSRKFGLLGLCGSAMSFVGMLSLLGSACMVVIGFVNVSEAGWMIAYGFGGFFGSLWTVCCGEACNAIAHIAERA